MSGNSGSRPPSEQAATPARLAIPKAMKKAPDFGVRSLLLMPGWEGAGASVGAG
jgi:hypothetical protein